MPPRTGQPAPDFTLPSHTGEAVTLSALRGRAVVLNFFPLAFSDVCTAQFRQIADGGAAYTAEDAVVLAVSVDHSDTHRAFAEATGADGVTFLSDFLPRGAVADAYGVFVPERGHSIRASFVVDAEGVLRHVEIPPTPLKFPDAEATRDAVRALTGA